MSAALPLEHVAVFGLASVRLIAFFAAVPFFGHRLVPFRIRLSLALLIAWWGAPLWAAALPQAEIGPLAFAVVREFSIGFAIGFSLSLVFTGIALMAEYVSIQGGFGAAAVLDPTSGAQSVVMTILVQAIAMLVFLTIDGHHIALRAIHESFARLPIGGSGPDATVFGSIAALGASIFDVALRIGAPITAVMLVSNAVVGALGRAIPQLNLMSVQLPAQIALLLIVLGVGAASWTETVAEVLLVQLDVALASVLGSS